MPDYSKGKVYRILSNSTDEIYIGSTINPLYKRFGQHKCDYKAYLRGEFSYVTSFEIIKYDDCKIVLVENCSCENIEQLRARERYWIENLECVNKQIPGRTKKEWEEANKERLSEKKQQWNEDNKEKIAEQKAQYRADNKEKISEYKAEYRQNNRKKIGEQQSEWYQKNKERIAEKAKEKFTCECGSTLTKGGKKIHEKSKKHQKYLQSPPPPAYTE